MYLTNIVKSFSSCLFLWFSYSGRCSCICREQVRNPRDGHKDLGKAMSGVRNFSLFYRFVFVPVKGKWKYQEYKVIFICFFFLFFYSRPVKPQDTGTPLSEASLHREVKKLKEADKDGTQTIIVSYSHQFMILFFCHLCIFLTFLTSFVHSSTVRTFTMIESLFTHPAFRPTYTALIGSCRLHPFQIIFFIT